jgi:hypothetical protein
MEYVFTRYNIWAMIYWSLASLVYSGTKWDIPYGVCYKPYQAWLFMGSMKLNKSFLDYDEIK